MTKLPLLLASLLGGCQVPDLYAGPLYEANLNGSNLACCIVRDYLHTPQAQPLEKGQNKPGDFAAWGESHGALQMALSDAGSMGVFSTDLNFGRDKSFTISATFQNPTVSGPDSLKPWAVGVVARTGGVDDVDALGRVQVTMQVKRLTPLADQLTQVELRVQDGLNADDTVKLKDSNGNDASALIVGLPYEQIFNSGQPFTIKLSVNRLSGHGSAVLTTATKTISIDDFVLEHFTYDSAEPLTAAGATLANQDPGRSVSIEVTHFEIGS